MTSSEARFQMRYERIRKSLLKYTRKAFRIIPQLDKSRILDVGCGSGVLTMELARLSDVIGIPYPNVVHTVLTFNAASCTMAAVNRSYAKQ